MNEESETPEEQERGRLVTNLFSASRRIMDSLPIVDDHLEDPEVAAAVEQVLRFAEKLELAIDGEQTIYLGAPPVVVTDTPFVTDAHVPALPVERNLADDALFAELERRGYDVANPFAMVDLNGDDVT